MLKNCQINQEKIIAKNVASIQFCISRQKYLAPIDLQEDHPVPCLRPNLWNEQNVFDRIELLQPAIAGSSTAFWSTLAPVHIFNFAQLQTILNNLTWHHLILCYQDQLFDVGTPQLPKEDNELGFLVFISRCRLQIRFLSR